MLNFRGVHLPKWNNNSKTLNFPEAARFPIVFVVLRPLHWAAIMTAERSLMVRTTCGESTWPCAGWEGVFFGHLGSHGKPCNFGGVYFTHMFVGIIYKKNTWGFSWVFVGGGPKWNTPRFCCLTWFLLGFWSNGCWCSNILGPKHRELYKWSFSNSNSCCFFSNRCMLIASLS